MPVHHPIAAWMLEHGSFVLNVVARGDDGRTPWHRARGRLFGQNLYAFGDQVLFKLPT